MDFIKIETSVDMRKPVPVSSRLTFRFIGGLRIFSPKPNMDSSSFHIQRISAVQSTDILMVIELISISSIGFPTFVRFQPFVTGIILHSRIGIFHSYLKKRFLMQLLFPRQIGSRNLISGIRAGAINGIFI